MTYSAETDVQVEPLDGEVRWSQRQVRSSSSLYPHEKCEEMNVPTKYLPEGGSNVGVRQPKWMVTSFIFTYSPNKKYGRQFGGMSCPFLILSHSNCHVYKVSLPFSSWSVPRNRTHSTHKNGPHYLMAPANHYSIQDPKGGLPGCHFSWRVCW